MAYQDWYKLEAAEVVKLLATSLELGLSDNEVVKRLKRFGRNVFKRGEQETILTVLARQLSSPLVLILVIAGFVTLFLRHYSDTVIIFLAAAINTIIGTIQEYRAGQAFKKLEQAQTRYATVVRNGRKKLVLAEEVVVGDLLELGAGSLVPADARVVEASALRLNESNLTGEWQAVAKEVSTIEAELAVPEQKNMVFMGTLVVAGRGLAVTVATGEQSKLGQLATLLGRHFDETPFQKSLKKLANFLILIILTVLALIFILGLWRGVPLSEMLLTAIALAVSAVPEGLPIAVTVVLVFGMNAILGRGGLVRSLSAAETLGSTTLILTDKTGTLTLAKMRLKEIVVAREFVGGEGKIDKDEVLRLAVLTSDAFLDGRDEQGEPIVVGRPVEQAIVLAGLEAGFEERFLSKVSPRLDFLPFEPARRFAASLEKDKAGKSLITVVGAPELLLAHSKRVLEEGAVRPLKRALVEKFIEFQEKRTGSGARVLAVAFRRTDQSFFPAKEKEAVAFILSDLVFAGLLILADPLRADAPQAVERVREAGLEVIMVTGDHKNTALAVAREVGIYKAGDSVLTGPEIEKMTDEELARRLKTARVLARILPHQKLWIANVLKEEGEVVAMTGDGVNDAPALEAADIGVALGSGTEVAKEASDLVLLNNSFTVIVRAIEEGRRILDNLKKIVVYLLTTSFGEVAVVVGALLTGNPLPILPAQILWANIIEEGFMNFAFAFEPKEPGLMRRNPRRNEMREILDPIVKKMIWLMASVTAGIVFLFYLVLLASDLPIERIRTLVFAAISINSIFYAFSLKDLRRPLSKIKIFSNRYLILSLALSLLMLLVALFVPTLRNLLQLVPISGPELALIFGLGLANLLIIEFGKSLLFRQKS